MSAQKCPVSVTTRDGGQATFKLNFVESGELSFPDVTADTGNAVIGAVSTASASANAAFVSRLKVAGQPPYVSESFIAGVNGQLQALQAQITHGAASVLADPVAFASQFKALQYNVANLIYTPGILANQLQNLYAALTDVTVLQHLAAELCGMVSADPDPVLAANADALNRLVASAVLVASSLASSQTAFVSYDDATRFAGAIGAAFDAELDASDADAFAVLLDLSAAVSADISGRAVDLPHILTIQAPQPVSTLELAELLYADAERAAEIADRNGVLHPGFCYGALQVLSA